MNPPLKCNFLSYFRNFNTIPNMTFVYWYDIEMHHTIHFFLFIVLIENQVQLIVHGVSFPDFKCCNIELE
jgi:hypothetical protein